MGILATLPGPCIGAIRVGIAVVAVSILAACGSMQEVPRSGPSAEETTEGLKQQGALGAVQIVNVDAAVARTLISHRKQQRFSDILGSAQAPATAMVIGAGDSLEVTLWEAPPATLFGSAPVDPRNPSTSRLTTLPEQTVDREGVIRVPFAGAIPALGRTTQEVQTEIVSRLKGKANQPEALVRITKVGSSAVTVVGEVATSVRLQLTPAGERLLDALAAAGGVRQPVHKMTVQVTRGDEFASMPLDLVIRDPKQNVPLRAGDVVTAIHQPLFFSALGATGKNEEVPFEAQGISLSQALARAGGLNDNRSDPKGVFIFRFEKADALEWPQLPVMATPEGLVPVLYRVNLTNPQSFFVMQSFPIKDKDVLYIANAPTVELQKFLNLVFSITYPVLGTANLINSAR